MHTLSCVAILKCKMYACTFAPNRVQIWYCYLLEPTQYKEKTILLHKVHSIALCGYIIMYGGILSK